MKCQSEFIYNEDNGEIILLPGSIWTFVITEKDGNCEIRYGQDSNANTGNESYCMSHKV